MKEDLLKILLRAEKQYHCMIQQSVIEAEEYVEIKRKERDDQIHKLEQEWELFEQQQMDQLSSRLQLRELELEAEMEKKRVILRNQQALKADIISDRLVKEVLTLHGNR